MFYYVIRWVSYQDLVWILPTVYEVGSDAFLNFTSVQVIGHQDVVRGIVPVP